MSFQNKTDNEMVKNITIDCTQNSIVKEEVIISDFTEDQNTHLDTLYSQKNRKKSKKNHVSDNINSLSEVDVNTSVASHNSLKLLGSSTVTQQNTAHSQAKLLINDSIAITLEPHNNRSVLKSGNTQIPMILKLSISKSIQNNTAIKIDSVEKDKSTVHVMNVKEKQIAIIKDNFTALERDVVKVDIKEQVVNKNKRFYHVVCLNCKKLKKPDDPSSKCQNCQNIFQYECLRCRDILPSNDEYYNHLRIKEFCPEIKVPFILKNDSYALATVMEKHQCSDDAWERAQKLISSVKISRKKIIDGKFKRIKSCCPICDDTFPVENGNFRCKTCNVSSVFKCQTCNRNYTTYCSAIYHTENHLVKKPVYECYDCSFKHSKKQTLFAHIRNKHLQKEIVIKQKSRKRVAQCSDCNLIITSNIYWRKHQYSCRKKVYFKCTLCSEKYLFKEDIKLHLLAAHEKTDSQALELLKEIEDDRNNQEEKKRKQKKQESLNGVAGKESFLQNQKNIDNNSKPKLNYITPYCINCNKTYEHLKISNNNNCPKCKSLVRVQCRFCKKNFKKYMIAYYHITKKCEKIKMDRLKEKYDRPFGKATKN